jgi:hypothetical protein
MSSRRQLGLRLRRASFRYSLRPGASRGVLAGVVSKPLLTAPRTQLRAGSQLHYLFGREVHPVRVQRVPLDLGDEVRFVVGMNLESAVAPKYLLHEPPR